LTSFGIGTNVPPGPENLVDYDWLALQPALEESTHLRHLRLARPLDIWVDGRSRRGLILKRG
jgi:hypothetical protein